MKRTDYIDWNTYFMGIALLSSMRSKDPNTQVGACLVDTEKKIVGIGYNGFPTGVSDDLFPWDNKSENYLENKYPYVVHAEANAILNANVSLKNCSLYVTLFPCDECAKIIIQSGIKQIYFLQDKYDKTPSNLAAKKMLDACKIKYIKLENFKMEIKV